MAPERVVIVGGGQAGAWAAKTLRDEGFAGVLTLIGEEQHLPYERPPLSKAVLAGTAAADTTHIFKSDLFHGLGLDWRRGRRAVAIDRAARRVRLNDQTDVAYDRLLLCTGGRARALAVDTATGIHVHVLRSLDDALALKEKLQTCQRLLVVGGGWIGLEVAATARRQGVAVHVVEALERPCARILPAAISERLVALHARNGVKFSLGASLARLEAVADGAVRAVLAGGETIDADCIVAGLGMLANDALARAAGLACTNGILVDDRCATADPAIFAAGDVAVGANRWAEGLVRLESWQNAQDQGIAAAKAMLGQAVRYDPVPRFWSDQYDVNVQIVGLPNAGNEIVMREAPTGDRFLAFALQDWRVRAVIGFNAGRDMRPARTLVERAALVDPARLRDFGVDLARVEVGTP